MGRRDNNGITYINLKNNFSLLKKKAKCCNFTLFGVNELRGLWRCALLLAHQLPCHEHFERLISLLDVERKQKKKKCGKNPLFCFSLDRRAETHERNSSPLVQSRFGVNLEPINKVATSQSPANTFGQITEGFIWGGPLK